MSSRSRSSTLDRLRPMATGPVGVDLRAVRSIRLGDLAIRFGFGFGVSVLAGLVSLAFGPSLGGMFLAFPAILPATLTLIDEQEGRRPAEGDAVGAVIGSGALGVFGLVSWLLLGGTSPVLAELAALVAWTATALSIYLVVRRALGARHRRS